MPTVYLPFGYPQLQGLEFANVIYQGEMVRLYTVPADPRNEAQIYQRELFADLARMRGTAGTFVRAVARQALGSRWTGVFTQIVKADVGLWWQDALARWDGFADLARTAWRAASPHQGTYNDMGKMFYATIRTLSDAILFYSGDYWGAEEWGEGDSAAALAWWNKTLIGISNASVPVPGQATGIWTFYPSYCFGNDVAGSSVWLWYYSSKANVFLSGSTPPANVRLKMNGNVVFQGYKGAGATPIAVTLPVRGLYYFHLEKLDSNYVNFGGVFKTYGG